MSAEVKMSYSKYLTASDPLILSTSKVEFNSFLGPVCVLFGSPVNPITSIGRIIDHLWADGQLLWPGSL